MIDLVICLTYHEQVPTNIYIFQPSYQTNSSATNRIPTRPVIQTLPKQWRLKLGDRMMATTIYSLRAAIYY